MNPFDEAIEVAGSIGGLATLAGVTRQAIDYARKRGSCTAAVARALEKATGGKVSKERLVFGDEPRKAPKRRKAA